MSVKSPFLIADRRDRVPVSWNIVILNFTYRYRASSVICSRRSGGDGSVVKDCPRIAADQDLSTRCCVPHCHFALDPIVKCVARVTKPNVLL